MKKTVGYTAVLILNIIDHSTNVRHRVRLTAYDFDQSLAEQKVYELLQKELHKDG